MNARRGRPTWENYPIIHMAADTADKVPLAALQDTAAFAARALLHIANDAQWPDMQRSKAEVARWKRENR